MTNTVSSGSSNAAGAFGLGGKEAYGWYPSEMKWETVLISAVPLGVVRKVLKRKALWSWCCKSVKSFAMEVEKVMC